MIGVGLSIVQLAVRQLLGRTFNPLDLFRNNEQGAWYDVNLTDGVLFQDSAGTTPVTAVEQPVGLMLDKSKGLVLGPQLVTNGGPGFTTTTGWTGSGGTLSSVSGALRVTSGGSGFGSGWISFATEVGKTYRFTFSVASNGRGRFGTSSGGSDLFASTTGTVSGVFRATGTTSFFSFFVNSGTAGETTDLTSVGVRELPGNHAFQTTSASRPVLSARVNLLTKTEQFDDVAWVKVNATVTANATVAPNGTSTADKLIPSNGVTNNHVENTFSYVSGTSYKFSLYIKAAGFNYFGANWGSAAFPSANRSLRINLVNGTVDTVNTTVASASCIPVGDGWYLITMTQTASATASDVLRFYTLSTQTTVLGNGVDGSFVWGADLRVSNDGVGLHAYQRVNTATDYDTTGFPTYLRFDGVDDWMQLANDSIDVLETSNQPFAMWAGVRRNTTDYANIFCAADNTSIDAANNDFVIFDLSLSTTQSGGSLRDFGGLTKTASAGTLSAPQTLVQTWTRTATTGTVRVNGTAGTAVDQTQPTLALKLYSIGARRRGSTPTLDAHLNGRLYSLIVRGAASTTAQIEATEAYVNSKTKAFA